MTITLVLPQPPAYSETFFRSKIKGLQESGHQVILVTANTKRKYEACSHLQHPSVHKNPLIQALKMMFVCISLIPYVNRLQKYIRLEKKEGVSFKRILEKVYINATLLKLKTDWLHFGFATMALERELVAKAIGAKMAVSLRGYDIDVYPLKHSNCYAKLWKQVDKVHSISHYLLEKARKLGLSEIKKHQVIHPAIDDKSMLNTIKKIDSSNKKVRIITIARLHWMKGLSDLIETANILQQSDVDFEWLIIGEGDLKHTERYKFHVYTKKLSSKIYFLGRKTHQETLKLLKNSHLYVQTSLSEGFCNAVLEAQAVGKLCIAYNSGALNENIIQDKTGWLVQKSQPNRLAKKIQEVLALPAFEKEKISKNAMQRAKNNFNLEKQKEEFHAFYSANY